MPDKYLSPKQVNEIYGIKPTMTYWWIHQGKIVHVKIGRSVLIPQKGLEVFLTENTVKPINEDDYEY